ncbi:hypothetical protein SAMN05443244_0299 [Terriglobus roseus]|uniref:Uncharacterized protein n=1 Tax=Terriglobus roseus TaxID=392734 RepID=A0A1H4J2W4_9BACT|nr:hypothetical protein SAMN05443244_0299 [Terriglobus roseus]
MLFDEWRCSSACALTWQVDNVLLLVRASISIEDDVLQNVLSFDKKRLRWLLDP